MMKGDFSRRTFRSEHHYSQVLMQQGRVQIDADWNEQVDIICHTARSTAEDTIGSHGAPRAGAGMQVVCQDADPDGGCPADRVMVSPGRYYVQGILCENEEAVPLNAQPDLPGVALPEEPGRYVAYLDVWSQHVSAVEQPDLVEVALRGPDTTTRARTVWQVRISDAGKVNSCADLGGWQPPEPRSTGMLRARASSTAQDERPCIVPVNAGYRRLENQLYRVEVHDPSDDTGAGATFVWSRENGSVAVRLDRLEGMVLTVAAPGRDDRLGFVPDGWVEVLPRERALRGQPGFLARLGTVDGVRLTVAEWRGTSTPDPKEVGEDAVVRRWESSSAVPVPDEEKWLDLEDGVQVSFEPGAVLRTGDYWLVPARTAILQAEPDDLAGDVEWDRLPDGEPVARPPAGITHHYAPIALLDRRDDGTWSATDCRHVFTPLSELGAERALWPVGGDGQEALPGDPLPGPLEVLVSRAGAPEPGATVHFTASDGSLAPDQAQLPDAGGSTLDVPTGGDGIARCAWLLDDDPGRPSQSVTARLLDDTGAAIGAPVDFFARLSLAAQVWYDAEDCPTMTGVQTVQEAIDRLRDARSLTLAAGDGQVGAPLAELDSPVTFLVRTSCGPVPGATVRCTVASGSVAGSADGLADGMAQVDLVSDSDGSVRCFWQLGVKKGTQLLTAAMVGNGASLEPPTTLDATATAAVGAADGRSVTRVVLLGETPRTLGRAEVVRPADLASGIAVVLDGAPDPPADDDAPLRLTVELPYPLAGSDSELWGQDVIGATPVLLSGDVRVDQVDGDPAVVWTPTDPGRAFLDRVLPVVGEHGAGDRLRCSLALSDLLLSTTPDSSPVHGHRSFPLWLADPGNDLVVVPTRAGVFRMKSAQTATQLAVARDELVERLPEGVSARGEVSERDLRAARTAADRVFDDRPREERRIVVLTEERFRPAAELLTEAFQNLEVTFEFVVVDDVVAAASERADAGTVDGVLCDRERSRAVAALSGFTTPVKL